MHKDDCKYLSKNVLPVICARIMQKNLTKFESIRLRLKNHDVPDSSIRPLTFLNAVIWKNLVEKTYDNVDSKNMDLINSAGDSKTKVGMVKFDCEASVSNHTSAEKKFGVVQLGLKPLRGVLSSLKSIRLDYIADDRYYFFMLPKGFHCHIREMTCNINTDRFLMESGAQDILNVLALKRDDKSQSEQPNVTIKTPALRPRFGHAYLKNRRLSLKLQNGKQEQDKHAQKERETDKSETTKAKKDEKDQNISSTNFSSLFTLGNTSNINTQQDEIKFEFGNKEKDNNNNWSFSFDTDINTSKDTINTDNDKNKSMSKNNNYNFCSFNTSDYKPCSIHVQFQ